MTYVGEQRKLRWAWLLALALALAAAQLAGCASSGRDVVTASDESDSAKRSRIRMELASAYFAQGQLTTALDEVKKAIAVNPSYAPAYNLRGLVYAAMSEDRLAEESFRRAVQLDGSDGGAMHNFGWFLCQRGRYDEAQSMFLQAQALPRYRQIAQTSLAQGVCSARAGRLVEAEKTLLHTYELDPGNPATAMNLADVLYRRGEFERARFYIRRVNNVAELSNAETLWLAARIEHKMGNRAGVNDFGNRLRNRFPNARETGLFDRGLFND